MTEVTVFKVYSVVSLAARYGLHSLRPASILVPTCPRPSCLTVIAPITSGATGSALLVFWSLEEHTAKDVTDRLSRLPHLDWNQPMLMFGVPTVLLQARGPEDGAGSLKEAEEILVSWIRTTKFGWMGNTFTVPQHRRQGLAGAATMALANQLLQEGLPAFVSIEDSNTTSVAAL
ncbi:Glycine N-acyltransferase-like protein 3 [Chionoecetes opilio]|uniref:Glycine N-acyltransferase-like protein 3 n=1 Tax=Chionoecetes opilio TaxID=41210 RepID=A0A8J5CSH2_CHIOP|nr:Glycine N-acyltransferase-like protein 3 [Chionoecetes opilio]